MEYKGFKIKINVSQKWDYKTQSMIKIYSYRITHLGYTIEPGRKEYEKEPECENAAKQAIDKLYKSY